MRINYSLLIGFIAAAGIFSSCDSELKLLKDPVTELSNDCIKRTLPTQPNIVGNVIEFAYAMAIPSDLGRLVSAQAVATIAGADGTRFDPNSYHTSTLGLDVPVPVCSESTTNGTTTVAQFSADTCAATLRYYYVIPESSRGKELSFTFSVKASNGQTAEYKLGPYQISKMDMMLNKTIVSGENCFLSFHHDGEAVHIYTAEEAVSANDVDLVYGYDGSHSDITHALYTPGTPRELCAGITFPAGMNGNAKLIRTYSLEDRQLSNLANSKFISDLDFQEKDFSGSAAFALRLGAQYGVWVETADAKYRAYVYVNSASAGKMTISVKRYAL